MGARHTSCTHLLWKPRGPSKEGVPVYLVTFETSRSVEERHSTYKQLLWKPRDAVRQGTPIYLVAF
jgi:hypothetical protein